MRATLFQQLTKIRAESAKSGTTRNKPTLDTSDLLPRSSFHRKRKQEEHNNSFNEYSSSFRFPDKERYEQEIKSLKSNMHSLENENLRLKTRIHQMEDNQLKQEKIIQELDRIGPVKAPLLQALNFSSAQTALKKEILNIRQELQKKDKELQNLKKTQRLSQITELQIERAAFQEETIRLRQQIDSLFKASLYNLQQNNVEQNIQERIFALVAQIQQHLIQQRELEKVIDRLKKECLKYRSQQIDSEYRNKREIKKLIAQLKEETSNNQKENNRELKQNPTKADELQNLTDLMFAKQEIKAKDSEIERLNQIIFDLEVQIKEMQLSSNLEAQDPQNQSQQLDATSKSKQVKISSPVFATEILQEIALPIKKSIVIQETQAVSKQPPRRRIIPVKFEDIKIIGETLKYRLMAMDIGIQQIDEYLYEGESMTIKELKDKLRLYPFNLAKDESLILARYIMEGENDIYELEDVAQNPAPYIRSVFRKILFNYKLEIVKSQFEYSEKIKDVLTRFKPFIISNIKQLYGKDCIRVSKSQFIDALTSLNIELNQFEIDYLIVQGILESRSVESLNYEEMLKYEPIKIEDQQLSFLLTEIANENKQKAEMSVIMECPEKVSEIEQQEQANDSNANFNEEQQLDIDNQYITVDQYVKQQFDSENEKFKQESSSDYNLDQ
ncbi:unnamed protein product (macronuclear) [Paramecium tetraurelia]|uniref:Letm1 RBD domain-containing protein n=1 Tax=Paramecium tetraurelia TaxID=5888 RepID=A0D6E4_PARTE|nr:uncharacterized protein GSPATT00001652001 [Paramecium tetraurelia]CAK78611.1 unnamed protein product [Paramecium tetraurelia]|eukprot:XP_001446008.1 hypothetical protein (macronuclear) [Paramecium tetraurelia strain d4-2]